LIKIYFSEIYFLKKRSSRGISYPSRITSEKQEEGSAYKTVGAPTLPICEIAPGTLFLSPPLSTIDLLLSPLLPPSSLVTEGFNAEQKKITGPQRRKPRTVTDGA